MVFDRHAVWCYNLLFVLHFNKYLKPEWNDQLKYSGEWTTSLRISSNVCEHESILVKPQHFRTLLVLLPLQLFVVRLVLLVLQPFPRARHLSVIPSCLHGSSDLLCAGSSRWGACGSR